MIKEMDSRGIGYLNQTSTTRRHKGFIFLYDCLQKSDAPTIPSVLYAGELERLGKKEVRELIKSVTTNPTDLLVKKNVFSHKGRSVEVYKSSKLKKATRKLEPYDIFQPFICSCTEEGFQRDYRVLFGGNNIVAAYKRISGSKLLDENGNFIKYPPKKETFVTNRFQGGKISLLDSSEYEKISSSALYLKKIFDEAEEKFRLLNSVNVEFQGTDFVGLDFLLDGDVPRFCEFHFFPEISDYTIFNRAINGLANHLGQKIFSGDYKDVMILDSPPISQALALGLKNNGVPYSLIDTSKFIEN